MYCRNCETPVEKDWKYCPKCRTRLFGNNIIENPTKQYNTTNNNGIINENVSTQDTQKERDGIIFRLILFGCGFLGIFLTGPFAPACFLLALVSLIDGCMKYPKRSIFKILLIIFILISVLFIVLIVWLINAFFQMLASCPG